jgi:hypothetical protein
MPDGDADVDIDGAIGGAGGVCSVHVHLATGNTVLPSLLVKAPLDGSRSMEKAEMDASSGARLSSAVPAS